jgi:5-methylcytosine-specific restriction endonuclease McrA
MKPNILGNKVKLINSHGKMLGFTTAFHHIESHDYKEDNSFVWEIQEIANSSLIRINNIGHDVKLAYFSSDQKIIASNVGRDEENWILHKASDNEFQFKTLHGTFLEQDVNGSLTHSSIMNVKSIWKVESIPTIITPMKTKTVPRKLTEARKKEAASRQFYKCKNSPGAKIESLTDFDCPLWKKPTPNNGSFDVSGYEIDHIVPWAETHDDSPENLQALCPSCHNRKHKLLNAMREPKDNTGEISTTNSKKRKESEEDKAKRIKKQKGEYFQKRGKKKQIVKRVLIKINEKMNEIKENMDETYKNIEKLMKTTLENIIEVDEKKSDTSNSDSD